MAKNLALLAPSTAVRSVLADRVPASSPGEKVEAGSPNYRVDRTASPMTRTALFIFLSFLLLFAPTSSGQSLERVGSDYFDEGPGVAVGSHDGNLYVLGDEKLYRIDLSNGSRHLGGGDYFDKSPGVAMASHTGSLFVHGNEKIYRIDLSNGSRHRVGNVYHDKPPGVAMASHGEHLYVLGNEKVYRVKAGE